MAVMLVAVNCAYCSSFINSKFKALKALEWSQIWRNLHCTLYTVPHVKNRVAKKKNNVGQGLHLVARGLQVQSMVTVTDFGNNHWQMTPEHIRIHYPT